VIIISYYHEVAKRGRRSGVGEEEGSLELNHCCFERFIEI
jgi:hypothetical protein